MRQRPQDGTGALQPTEEQPHEQRSARDAEGEGLAAGERHHDEAEQQAEPEAEEQADGVDVGGTALGVAEVAGHLLELGRGPDDADPIAERQHQVVGGEQVDVAATDARRRRVEAAGEVEVADRAPRDLAVRHGHPSEVELRAVLHEGHGRGVAEVGDDLRDRVGVADDGEDVAVLRARVGLGHPQRAGVVRLVADHVPGEHHAVAVARREAGEVREVVAVDPDGRAGEQAGRAGRLATGVGRAGEPRRDPGREHHAEHAAEVGDRVADDGLLGLPQRRAGGQGRGVGERTGVDAGEHGSVQVEQLAHHERHACGRHEERHHRREQAAPGAQRGEERRSRGDADAVGEQREPELTHHHGQLEPLVVGGEREREEQHSGRTEGEATDRDGPDHASDREEQAEQDEGVGRQQVGGRSQVHGAHPPAPAGRRAAASQEP